MELLFNYYSSLIQELAIIEKHVDIVIQFSELLLKQYFVRFHVNLQDLVLIEVEWVQRKE